MNKIEELKEIIEKLKNLEEGWDDDKCGVKIDLKTIQICEDLFSYLYQYYFVPRFKISPISTGEIWTDCAMLINSENFYSLQIYFIPKENKIQCYCLVPGRDEECDYNMDSSNLKDEILDFIKRNLGKYLGV